MHKKLVKIPFIFLVILASTPALFAKQTITGDSTTAGQTTTFPFSTHLYERIADRFFVAAQQPTSGTAAHYAIAYAGANANSLVPLVPNLPTTINGVAAPNPLLGAHIDHIGLIAYNSTSPYIAAVPHAAPGIAYLMFNGVVSTGHNTLALLSTGTFVDAFNNPTPRIAALTTNVSQATGEPLDKYPTRGLQHGMALFAAVTNHTGIFGEPGSGIATAVLQTDTTSKQMFFEQLITTTLDISSPVVAIGSPLTEMADAVILKNSIHWRLLDINNPVPVSKVYVGLQVQGGAGASDGVHGVVAYDGFTLDKQLITKEPVLTPLAPEAAISQDSIIAAVGPSAAVNIYHIANMTTTSHLHYLVIVGGVAPQGTKRTVFALPLVTETGLLANVNATQIPHTVSPAISPFLVTRFFPAATQAGDLYTSTSIQARVGGGALPGDVTDISTAGDTVFASISTSSSVLPGIFYSQALFDEVGKIKGWTHWQRVGNAISSTTALAFDERTGNFLSVQPAGSGTLVQRTLWEKPQQGVPQFLQEAMRETPGGIQGLFEFPVATPEFDQTTSPLAVTVATGKNHVVMVQSGQKVNDILEPTTNFSNGFSQTDGTLQGFVPGVSWLQFSGGVVQDIGPIIAATIISDGTYAWFVVGGARGVAILARPDGTGWLVNPGLQSGFVGLSADMRWMRLGNYAHVRKLVSNEQALYVLTHTTLERINISPSTIAQGERAAGVVVAQGGSLPELQHTFLSDVIISKKVGLLATSSGLLRVGDGSDITRATSAAEIGWTPVPLPYGVGPVSRLFGISVTGLEQDIAQVSPAVSGNVYVLNAYVGYNQSRVYRFTINYTGTVDAATIQPLYDIQSNGLPGFFLTFGRYRNFITTDGSLFAVSRSKRQKDPAYFELLAAKWMVESKAALTGAQRIVPDATAQSIGHMIRSSVTGSWLVPGDFGLYVNE